MCCFQMQGCGSMLCYTQVQAHVVASLGISVPCQSISDLSARLKLELWSSKHPSVYTHSYTISASCEKYD